MIGKEHSCLLITGVGGGKILDRGGNILLAGKEDRHGDTGFTVPSDKHGAVMLRAGPADEKETGAGRMGGKELILYFLGRDGGILHMHHKTGSLPT